MKAAAITGTYITLHPRFRVLCWLGDDDEAEVITTAEFHPSSCSMLAYGSSSGLVRLVDLRRSALCDHSVRMRVTSVFCNNPPIELSTHHACVRSFFHFFFLKLSLTE